MLDKQTAALRRWLAERAASWPATRRITSRRCRPDVTPARLAAWTAVSRVLLNLDETITKE